MNGSTSLNIRSPLHKSAQVRSALAGPHASEHAQTDYRRSSPRLGIAEPLCGHGLPQMSAQGLWDRRIIRRTARHGNEVRQARPEKCVGTFRSPPPRLTHAANRIGFECLERAPRQLAATFDHWATAAGAPNFAP